VRPASTTGTGDTPGYTVRYPLRECALDVPPALSARGPRNPARRHSRSRARVSGPDIPTWSRACGCGEALLATAGPHGIMLRSDPDHPLGRAEPCAAALRSLDRGPRIRTPRRREGTRWVETSWEEALDAIGARLKEIRRTRGTTSIALQVGAEAAAHTQTAARVAGIALAWGTPHVYGPLADGPSAAWLRACEWVTGTAFPLQGDLGRAHYVVLLGANGDRAGWGPLQAGGAHGADLAFSRKTKGTKVIAVDPARTPLAQGADVHVQIRPGSELYFVLGMIDAILRNEWRDVQYTDDYCSPLSPLREALAPFTLDRCAALCGVAPSDIGGVALKFSRSAMALAHRSPQALSGPHATLTAWAILVLHALTANLLRPGGVFDAAGAVDLHVVARQLASASAPRTASGCDLLLGQAPAETLTDDIRAGGPRALIAVQADPYGAAGPGDAAALDGLDLVVALESVETETTRRAHWVLPVCDSWERAALRLFDGAVTPARALQDTPAIRTPPDEARDEADVLAQLHARVGTALRADTWGPHLRIAGAWLADGDLERLTRGRMLGWADVRIPGPGETITLGEIDRATWRVNTSTGRLDLLPAPVREALEALDRDASPPQADACVLMRADVDTACDARGRPLGGSVVAMHPARGWAEGQAVRVRVGAHAHTAVVRLDESLRPDTVEISGASALVATLGEVLPRDRFTRAHGVQGVACTVEPA
jgi:anaerobic selenocysteine-containing dehydrogenase